jgi:large exoprotein involved in heme utilization and adhesion
MKHLFPFRVPTMKPLSCISTKTGVLLLVSLVSFPLGNFNHVHAAGPPTAISGTPAGVGGLNTLVNSNPTNLCSASCVITGGTRSGPNGTGPNLFHSFAQFSVGAGDIATFLNNTGLPTSNILARVTGTTA